jgi:hypothetical protein
MRIFAVNDRCFLRFDTSLQVIGEQPALGQEVVIHIAMIIEMIARQIGEDANVEFQSAHSFLS